MKLPFRHLPLLGLVIGLLSVTAVSIHAAETSPLRVACVGDSITAGVGASNIGFESYPAQLGRMLGDGWKVGNFGNSGSTLLNQGDKPYQKQDSFTKALAFNPNVVVIMLGTNDTKPQNWKFKAQFVADYKDLIGKFKTLETKPRIFICHPPLVPGKGNYGINEEGVLAEIPLIDGIAKDESVTVVDVHGAFAGKDTLFPDRVHPSTAGHEVLARTVFKAITGKEFKGTIPSTVLSSWEGYQRMDFVVDTRSCLLVAPKTPLPGKPWIWRTEFFGAFPSVDKALLAKGYYVAYMDVHDMYGAPVALNHMDKFYDYLTKTYGLSPKTVPEGFSRGGLYAFNWTARNPTKVASIYVDAPVCDFKSWPACKGKSKGNSPADWERCKKVYGFTSDEQALAYPLNPIDNLKPIATAKIPIIAVVGGADDLVPMDENIDIVEARYKQLGGEIKVIVKPGVGHHPHSLSDPTPVVDFILGHR
ncbi:MAG TPA: GDSL-type esterase/lipase family protein [Rariglobus sp.]|jgi:lysophospholipase L1-like esterase/pimeloyl-ACP methyl ester carboxylesterase|nr:GDSL-type esterase/lipase family protein [Rariglobus sp.]